MEGSKRKSDRSCRLGALQKIIKMAILSRRWAASRVGGLKGKPGILPARKMGKMPGKSRGKCARERAAWSGNDCCGWGSFVFRFYCRLRCVFSFFLLTVFFFFFWRKFGGGKCFFCLLYTVRSLCIRSRCFDIWISLFLVRIYLNLKFCVYLYYFLWNILKKNINFWKYWISIYY